MAFSCDHCEKGIMVGKQHKHHPGVAGGRWKKRAPKTQKIFRPNLHWARIMENGTSKRVRLCTKCLRRARLDSRLDSTRLAAKRAKEAMKPVVKETSVQASILTA